MAIPFFSIDLEKKDIFNIVKNIIFPFNIKKSRNEIHELLKERFKNKYVNLLPSARLGFYLTLKKKFKENDEIIFSSMSFPLYIKIANQLKLKVKLVDVEKKNLNIDIVQLEKNINKNTKGIVVTHLFGYPCEMDKIKEISQKNNLVLIEDCAQSFGTFYKKVETGNFGDVGIYSCSLIKIPTTLGGGILITSDKSLNDFINNWIEENIKFSFKKNFSLIIKNILSIANSFPFLYSILASKVFFFLNKFNPRIYRKIIYSGMGLKNKEFNPSERPNLSKYQIKLGISQIKKFDLMKKKRIANSHYLKKNLENLKNISFLEYDENVDWNRQYFIIKIDNNYNDFNRKLFNLGIHAMEENVWNCLEYNYDIINKDSNFDITKKNNCKILRIQNSSYLNKKHLDNIIWAIKKIHND